MRAADVIVEALRQHGVERVFCVPGESYLSLLDALVDAPEIATIPCRHESGAGFMAVAEAKLTGKPGVFMVSRGPGATNGSIALHVAEQDAVPVICFIGQVSREERTRGAFQEVDYGKFFGPIAKGVWEVSDGERLPEALARAFHLAANGTPGPVVIALPEDMLGDEVHTALPSPFPLARSAPALDQVGAVAKRLAAAERPLLIVGGAVKTPAGTAALAALAERHQVPVATTWKNQEAFDNNSRLFAGHLGFGVPAAFKEQLSRADLIIAIGTRLGDVGTLNYQLPQAPEPRQPLIHVYPDPAVIGRVFRTELGIVADPVMFLQALAACPATVPAGREAWVADIARFIEGYSAFSPRNVDDGVDFGAVVHALSRQAAEDAILITDSGNFSSWLHRHWKLTPKNTLLGAIAGAMGFGVPAGVAASLIAPGRQVIVLVGDGGTLMTGQELATAIAIGCAPKLFISDNGSYGTIRTHQEREFPRRVSGTELVSPDFAAWARSFGAKAITIDKGDDIAAKVREALDATTPVVVHVKSSLESISAYTTLSALRGGR
ncbi:thiamine pyrophosphate-dependent enzyme [Rhodoligotrophos defluvii]|uniref:thiamine pyrophosphate-dependent enzyme n=1 Tax=Rhodoligotrophos defluvii TaxID=2561934 RepID=UPI0010CA11F6|nr:thiamine pyrophosphate-dependent enzyme [Rhodoligotrophos defluvii]